MNDQQTWAVIGMFVVQSLSVFSAVVILGLWMQRSVRALRELVESFGAYLRLVGNHGSLTDATAKRHSDEIVKELTRVMKAECHQVAIDILRGQMTQKPVPVPPPPVPPSGVHEAHIIKKDSAKSLIALAISFVMVGMTAAQSAQSAGNPIEAMGLQKSARFSEAVKAWRELDPQSNDLKALAERAYCEYRAERFSDAFATCGRMLTLDPKCGRAHHLRGLIFKRGGFLKEARAEFTLGAEMGDKYAASQLEKTICPTQ